MKKCPTCERTFEDSMRFCQSDGTPLVDDAPPLDPYKTMVARPGEIAAATPPASSGGPVPEPHKEEEVLQLPAEPDPLKTMYASEAEIRKEMDARDAKDEVVMDIPPLAPEPPKFAEPSLSPPSFGSPPSSPFSPQASDPIPDPSGNSPLSKSTPPIPSPFTDPKPSTYDPPPPNFPEFKDPEPLVVNTASASPFDPPSSATPEWTPPPAIEPSHQKENMQNPSFTPSPAAAGQNKTLAIVSLVIGILSIFCCGWFVPGIAAIVTGFMAKSKANNDTANYGGAGLALGGIITGAVSLVLGVIVVVLYLFGFLAGVIGNMGR